jgi:hypothetical protein
MLGLPSEAANVLYERSTIGAKIHALALVSSFGNDLTSIEHSPVEFKQRFPFAVVI